MSHVKTAPVDMFTTLRPRPFMGRLLKDIKAVQASISQYGLLSPIIVSRTNNQLVVLDGRKRLAAIKRLAFMGRLPRSLVNIPYLEIQDMPRAADPTPALMSNRELYQTVTQMFRNTQDVEYIASELFLTRKGVKQILTLCRLSPRLRRSFFDKTISFESARAYAAFPSHNIQEQIFSALGPFAEGQDILDHGHKNPTPEAPAPLRLVA